jgi:hypothetical protein
MAEGQQPWPTRLGPADHLQVSPRSERTPLRGAGSAIRTRLSPAVAGLGLPGDTFADIKAGLPSLDRGHLSFAKGTSRFSLRRARASRPRGGRRRSCSWRSSRPAAPVPAITSSPSGRAGMVGVSDGCDRDGAVAGQGAWAAAHLGSGSVNSDRCVGYRSCSESGGSTRCGDRDRWVERETERLPLGLGRRWSGWTVAGWVDEVLRRSAAACEDGEDFGLKDVA